MKVETDWEKYCLRSSVLVTQLVRDTFEVLEQYGLFKPEQNKDLARDLLFRICAVLDGSSFPGRLDDQEIAPFVGFYSAESSEGVLIPKDGSGMHEIVFDVIDAYVAGGGGT